METLMVFSEHRSQYSYPSNNSHPTNQFSSPSRTFRSMNCRTFQTVSTPPRTPPLQPSKPINILSKSSSEDLSLCQPFAGPAYSNSPPPSSLPIPKFSLRQKRSVSLDLPTSRADVVIRPIAKSAPSSPTGERVGFSIDAAIATVNLKRILRLDDE